MKRAALKVSAGLSLLFVVVYPVCNWLASRRTDVGTWAYAWEQKIPFVPWLIFPYWSIDLFFVAAPFVCRDRAELRVLAQRVACAIVAAGICFVAMPLRIVFPRPEVTGVPGMLFSTLWQFDQPHNLFPSLHIALWLILRAVYVRHTGGATRWLVRLWFLAIGLSAVLTWQHQVVDVAGASSSAPLFQPR